jgi:hypothetical protein
MLRSRFFIRRMLVFLTLLNFTPQGKAQSVLGTEVLVVGGGTGGIGSAIQSARSGAKTLLVEKTHWLGGMLTSAGVSCTDGNDGLPSGIWEQFRQALYRHYGTRQLGTGWVSATCFEPHVGDSIFKAWALAEPNLKVLFGWRFLRALRTGNSVRGAVFTKDSGKQMTIRARVSVDATELGDLLADAKAGYDEGTEDSSYSHEKMAPGRTDIIQDLTWVAVLKDFRSDHTLDRPAGYRKEDFFCCCTDAPCPAGSPYPAGAARMMAYGKLPQGKFMINWPAHGNDSYLNVLEISEAGRKKAYEEARQRTLNFVYFLQTELGFRNLGLATDECDGGLGIIPYNREGRRVRGVVRLSINDILAPFIQTENLYRTGISVGDYPVDHHHGSNSRTPPIQFPQIPSFNIPLGALIPEKTDGLLVCEKGISVSNIVNGASRLQPVVLLTGQAAGVLAAWSVREKRPPREADVREIQQELLDIGTFLMPYADLGPSENGWAEVQRIGATGVLRGRGKSEGWANKTYFDPDSLVETESLMHRLSAFRALDEVLRNRRRSSTLFGLKNKYLTRAAMDSLLWDLRPYTLYPQEDRGRWSRDFLAYCLKICKPGSATGEYLTKKETALLLDHYLDLFRRFPVDLRGNFQQ